MVIELLSLEFLRFLERNRLAVGGMEEIMLAFKAARASYDVLAIAELLRQFPALKNIWDDEDNLRRQKDSDEVDSSDEQFCRDSQQIVSAQRIANNPQNRLNLLLYLLQWSDWRNVDIADIGCGSCDHLIFFKKLGMVQGRCFGLDMSVPSLALTRQLARSEGADVRLMQGMCFSLPFSDQSLGQIWAFKLLPWVIKWRETVLEFHRVLKPGGRIVLAHNDKGKRCRVTTDGLVAFLQESGFHVDDVTYSCEVTALIAAGKR